MFGQFFGNYLTQKGYITTLQFNDIIRKQETTHVKLGTIAVSEKMLTSNQAAEINRLQAQMDKRFGDIAIEKGYLSPEQVTTLLAQQGNPYLRFIQSLEESSSLSLCQIEEYLVDYQSEFQLTDEQLEDLISGDIDKVIPLFINSTAPLCNTHLGIALRTINRFINTQFSFKNLCNVHTYEFENLATQCLRGQHNIFVGFAGNENSLLSVANPFADETFKFIDEDSFDAVCEFINCINGLFASQLSNQKVRVDMLPPVSYTGKKLVSNNGIWVLTICIDSIEFDILIAIDSAIDIV